MGDSCLCPRMPSSVFLGRVYQGGSSTKRLVQRGASGSHSLHEALNALKYSGGLWRMDSRRSIIFYTLSLTQLQRVATCNYHVGYQVV